MKLASLALSAVSDQPSAFSGDARDVEVAAYVKGRARGAAPPDGFC
ncbi:MAG: hypothetical protein M3494_07970 [Actinomycetota bacterium]|nr:hypothetical protein [Actinomycetota bacterium]